MSPFQRSDADELYLCLNYFAIGPECASSVNQEGAASSPEWYPFILESRRLAVGLPPRSNTKRLCWEFGVQWALAFTDFCVDTYLNVRLIYLP